MLRIFCSLLGFIFLFIGIIGMLTPIPFGLLFVIIALMLLIPSTPWFARLLQRSRTRSGMVNKAFDGITRRAPAPYKRVLRETEPTDSESRW